MRFGILGSLEVISGAAAVDVRGPKCRAVLALLLVDANRAVPPDRLVEDLWEGSPPPSAIATLQSYVSVLRRAIGAEAVRTTGSGYVLDVGAEGFDALRFEQILEEVARAEEPDAPWAEDHLRGALSLWRGPALTEFAHFPWAQPEAARLEELRLGVLEDLADVRLKRGDHVAVASEMEGLVAAHPFRERLWALLMLALYRSDRQADALRAFGRLRTILGEELGIEPAKELARLEAAILRQKPELDRVPVPGRVAGSDGRGVTVCPYKGLARFESSDAAFFFGRDRVVGELVGRLASSGFVAVIGPSGSGKSSLLRAGLVPALKAGALPGSDRWPSVVLPAADDLGDRVERAVDRPLDQDAGEGRLLVAIDQLEEAFTRGDREAHRVLDAIVRAATDPNARFAVVVALRADFYGYCAAYPDFAGLVTASQVLVGAMSDAEVHAAIEEPAGVAGLELEAGLADIIAADVEAQPGALPLLSTALLETWVRRRGGLLTEAGYRDAGGVAGAVTRLAEHTYLQFTPADRAVCQRILGRLAAPRGNGDARRRVPLAELTDPSSQRVLDALVERRLVTTSEGTAEVAHEALLGEWPRLRAWLDENRDGRLIHQRMAVAAVDWDAARGDPAELLRGARLSAALDWSATHPDELNPQERVFLDTSENAHDAELRATRRTTRQLRVLAGALGSLVVVAVVAGLIAVIQRGDADRQASRASRAATLAQATQLATLAQTLPPSQIDLALLLGAEGHRLVSTAATDGGLEAVLDRVPASLDRVLHFGASSAYASATPDGRFLAAPGTDGLVRIWDLPKGQLLHTLRGHSGSAFVALFNRDATLVSAGGFDGKVVIWDVRTGARVGPPIEPGGTAVYGVFDPASATRVFTVSDDGSVAHWDLRDAQHPQRIGEPFTFPAAGGEVPVGVISPDGRLLAAGGATSRRTVVWDIATHRQVQDLPGAPGGFSPDSRILATSGTNAVVLWDVATGTQNGEPLSGLTTAAPATVFSADGRLLAVGDESDNTIHVFDLASRQPVRAPLALHSALALPSTFLADGRLVTTGADEAAVWNVGGQASALETTLGGHTGTVVGQFSPDGTQTITVGLDDGRVLRWSADGLARGAPPGAPAVTASFAAFSPDGARSAFGGVDGTFSISDRRTGQRLARVETGMPGRVGVSWSPRHEVLATTALDEPSDVVMWNVSDPRHPVPTHHLRTATSPGSYPALTFSPDGRLLVVDDVGTSVGTGSVTIFEASTGRRVRVLREGTDVAQVAFTPDGTTLAMAVGERNGTGRVVLLDAVTLRQRGTLVLSYLPGGLAYVDGGRRFVTTSFPPAASGAATRIDLWQAATLQPVGIPLTIPATGTFLPLADARGTRLAAGSASGTLTVVDLDPRSWARTACHIAGRNLTNEESARYLPGVPHHATCSG